MKLSEIKIPFFPSEFRAEPDYYSVFDKNGLMMGRMVGGSKLTYSQQYPDHQVVFNANIITKKHGKIWYGDLDMTLDFDDLKNVADELGEDLYILREHDARFENENLKFKEYAKMAVEIIKTDK